MSEIRDKKIEIREVVYSQDDEKSFGDVFIYEPENIEEQNLGNLFIVGELKDLPRNCSYVMNVLASKIKKEFYSNTKRTTEESLEAGLSEANKVLADLAEQGNGEYVSKLSMVCGAYRGNSFYLSQIGKIKSLLIRGGQIMEIVKGDGRKAISPKRAFNNIASGELTDGDLVMFATSGLFNIFSMEQLRRYGGSMKLNEFSAKLQEEIEEENSETVSALLIEIEGEKKILIEHSEILTEREKETTEESLKKALNEGVEIDEDAILKQEESAKDDAAGARAEVEEKQAEAALSEKTAELKEDDSKKTEVEAESNSELETKEKMAEAEKEESLASAKYEEKTAKEPKSDKEKRMPESPSEAPNKELATARELRASESHAEGAAITANAPSFTAIKDSGKISLSDIIREYEKMESRKSQELAGDREKNIEEVIAKKEIANFEDLDEEEKSVFGKIIDNAKNILSSFKKSVLGASFGSKLKNIVGGKKEYRVERGGKKFSLGGKKILAVGVIVLIVGVGGYSYYSSKKEADKKAVIVASYQSLLDQSEAKMNEAEVQGISGSEDAAGKLYLEARALAQRVKDEYDGFDSEADGIIDKAQAEIDKIDKVAHLDGNVIAAFDNSNIRNFVEASGAYYLVDGQGKSLYKADADAKSIVEMAKADSGNALFCAKNLQGAEILLSDGSDFLSYNLKNGKLDKLAQGADMKFVDFATYGRYVYLLSPSDNQIYKYQKGAGGLESKIIWLKDSSDMSKAVSLAIDQYIYVLTSDGQVKKYYTGEEYIDENGNKFSLKQPLDPLASPTRIYTSTDQANLYVLEPSRKRVVVFDRNTGGLIKQIVNDDLADARDIFVDAEEENLVVLVKDKLLKISLM